LRENIFLALDRFFKYEEDTTEITENAGPTFLQIFLDNQCHELIRNWPEDYADTMSGFNHQLIHRIFECYIPYSSDGDESYDSE